MAKKKSVKAGSKAKTKVGKRSVSLRELPGRHMRLTQEFDRLSTMVARQGQLLQGIYLVLQQAKLMPYAPEQMGTPVKAKGGAKVDQGSKMPVPGSMQGTDLIAKRTQMFVSAKQDIKEYDVVLKRNGQILGYLAEDKTWTLDPKQIKTWSLHEDALKTATQAIGPDGAIIEVRGHR